ncbi:unnamed protein product [Spirodela intermedia]|uniref:Uncharacterized protein n=1 Tax=Spirodela intermedia TaxID=51605 RepID=A0ABN7ECV9_SPIIN|nr:unnamed protein product [Spirodela intermedia]
MGRQVIFGGCHPAEWKNETLRLSGGCHPTERRSWMEVGRVKVPSLVCMTTPCPTISWPPMTWKGSGAHMPLSI